MNARGPRLLIPSGLLGVALATLAVLAVNARRYPGEVRAILIGALAVVACDAWAAHRALRRLDAEMLTPSTAVSGTPFHARATVRGVTRPATVDPLSSEAEPTGFDGEEPFELSCHPAPRGVFNHLLVEVRCRSPLGLWASARRIAVRLREPLWVGPLPRPCPDGPLQAPLLGSPSGAGEPAPASSPGPTGDLVRSTRAYVPGDPSRLVHWPATAHEGRLMVRETEDGHEPLAAVVVDLHEPGTAAEEALGRAATASTTALARDGRVRLVTVERAPGAEPPLPRAILMPAAGLRSQPTPALPTRTVDRVETTEAGLRRRLAAASVVRVEPARIPPEAWVISDRGDRW